MSVDQTRLMAVVAELVRRERVLVARSTGARLLLWLAGVLAAVAAIVWIDPPRATGAAWLVLVAGVGLWHLVVRPWRVSWHRAADALRQARLLEAREPALRGRLVTVVGHAEGTRGAESPALLALVARRALPMAERHPPEVVHPGQEGKRWAAAAALSVAAALLVWGMVPGGGSGVLRWWTGEATRAGTELLSAEEGLAPARVGDLTLRYIYPDYTGLEPYEVVNSTGEAHGVPGTRVEVVARSAEVIESAALRAYDLAATELSVREGRLLSGAFVIGPQAGTWRILTSVGGETHASKAFPIVTEPDLAPQVVLEANDDVVEVALDQPLGMRWSATDDFGITRVSLQVDGKEGRLLRSPRERQREVEDDLTLRPQDLGMEAGREYQVAVAASDNDTVSGAKQGVSNVVRVIVLGEDGTARLNDEGRDELIGILLDLLAAHLVEAFPPGSTAGQISAWGEKVNRRYAPLSAFLDARKGRRSRGREWGPVVDAMEEGRMLVRYTQTSFLPESTATANAASLRAVTGFRDTAIAAVEHAVLHLDAIVRADALTRTAAAASDLEENADALEAALDRPNLDPQELAARTETLQSFVGDFERVAERMGENGLRELVLSRAREADALLQETRKALVTGRTPEAQALAARVADRLRETAAGIREELARQEEEAEKGANKAKELLDQLKVLKARQEELAVAVEEIRAEGGAAHQEKVAGFWKRIDAQVAVVRDLTLRFHTDLMGAGRAFNEVVYVEEALERAEGLRASAAVRDPLGLFRGALELEGHWGRYADRHTRFVERGQSTGEPGASRIGQVGAAIATLLDLIEQVRRQDESADPGVREAVGRLQAQQAQLQQDLSDARQDAKRVAQEMPVTPRQLEPALESAGERMGEAATGLGRGEAMQAEGSQRAASQHVQEAIDALQRAMQQSAGQQPQSGEDEGEGSGERKEGEEEGGKGKEMSEQEGDRSVDLPEPEEFRTPEDYRRALLEGMESDVPEAYRALKRRYYEELVHP